MITINSMPYNKSGSGPVYASEEERRLWKAALGDYIRGLNFQLVSGLDFNYSFEGGLVGGARFEASGLESYFGTPQVYNQYLYLVIEVDHVGKITTSKIVNQQTQGYTEQYNFSGIYSKAIFELFIPANSTQIVVTNFNELVMDIALIGSDINTIEEILQYKETVYTWEEFKLKYNVTTPTTFTTINSKLLTKEKIIGMIPISEINSTNLPAIVISDGIEIMLEMQKYAPGYSKISIDQTPTASEPLGFDTFCYNGWNKYKWDHTRGTRTLLSGLALANGGNATVRDINNWQKMRFNLVTTNFANEIEFVRWKNTATGTYLFDGTIPTFYSNRQTLIEVVLQAVSTTTVNYSTAQMEHTPGSNHSGIVANNALKELYGVKYKEV